MKTSFQLLLIIFLFMLGLGLLFEFGSRIEPGQSRPIVLKERSVQRERPVEGPAQRGLMRLPEPAEELWRVAPVIAPDTGQEVLQFVSEYRPFDLASLGISDEEAFEQWVQAVVEQVMTRDAQAAADLVLQAPDANRQLITVAVTLRQIRAYQSLPPELSGGAAEKNGSYFPVNDHPVVPVPAPEAAYEVSLQEDEPRRAPPPPIELPEEERQVDIAHVIDQTRASVLSMWDACRVMPDGPQKYHALLEIAFAFSAIEDVGRSNEAIGEAVQTLVRADRNRRWAERSGEIFRIAIWPVLGVLGTVLLATSRTVIGHFLNAQVARLIDDDTLTERLGARIKEVRKIIVP